jgi:TorA maturation chaperone TorD
MAGQADEQVEQELAVDWTRLFRGLRPGYGPPPPYEGVYLGGDGLQAIQAVARFYHSHGLGPADGAGNRPDYIGLELDFLRHACEQQAGALEKGETGEAEKWQEVEESFLEEHTGKWIGAYCERAIAEARTDFYRGTLRLMGAMIGKRSWDAASGSTMQTTTDPRRQV